MIHLAVKWLPDETFYSICCRQHVYFGNVDSATTTKWLFGSGKKYVHDFTYNLDALSDFMVNTWGSPTSIIYHHTIVPFFFPFQTQGNVLAVEKALRGEKLGSLKYRLGLLTGRFGAAHPLKACTACMVSDRLDFGVAYWHLSHQYPGVILCSKHCKFLRESTANRQWSGGFEWLLPTEENLLPPLESATSVADEETFERLAAAIIDLAAFGSTGLFNPNAVCAAYKSALADYGNKKSGITAAACSLAAYSTRLRAYPPFGCLPNEAEGAAALLGSLVRPARGRCHPLKHLTVITWLLGSLHEFICLHDQMLVNIFQSEENLRNDAQPNHVIQNAFVQCSGRSLVVRRPKFIRSEIRAEILLRLSSGNTKQSVCSDFHITVSAINKLLRSEPLVKEAWQMSICAKEKTKRRLIWEETVRNHTQESAKQIRQRIGSVYAWLYRNDRQWLNDKIRQLPTGRIGNHSTIDWEGRDYQLEADLAATARALTITHGLPLTRQMIFSALPRLATALEKRQAYWRTRSLLHDLIRTISESANRTHQTDAIGATERKARIDQSP